MAVGPEKKKRKQETGCIVVGLAGFWIALMVEAVRWVT
jgi:hypothetical protein